MKRRDFITLAGGAVLMAPQIARAQPKVARIGFLGLVSASSHASRTSALRAGLRELGYVEGKNLAIEFRWAEGNYERLPALAEELVRLKVDVLLTHGASGAFAAKRATSTIPIVITAAGDIVELGLVSSLSRPGGNITGLSLFSAAYTAKRLELMKEAIPFLTKAALLVNPDNATYGRVAQEVETTAKALNVELRKFNVRLPGDIERAFSAMADAKIEAVVVHEDTVLLANAAMIANFAMSMRLPSCGPPELVKAGGLIAYGINFPDTDHRAATFVDKILKGAKPGDLPIERSTKFDVIVKLKTAKAIGVTLPTAILLRADEVIE